MQQHILKEIFNKKTSYYYLNFLLEIETWKMV